MKHNQLISELGPLLIGLGLSKVVICPGSRNAPLIQLFTSNPVFRCWSIVDERSAAYFALGMACLSGEPVIVLTTSGTAVLNLAPAVAEAHYQQMPLLLITADRPREYMLQFNNQVINQFEAFKGNSKGFCELPGRVDSANELKLRLEEVRQLIEAGRTFPEGPVHLNVYLNEPLYEKLPESKQLMKSQGTERSSGTATRTHHRIRPLQPEKKVLVLAGMGGGKPEIRRVLKELTGRGEAAVVAENISNYPSAAFIQTPELLLAGAGARDLKDLAPDAVIMFGGQVVSKRLKTFLQSCNPEIIYPGTDPAGELAQLFPPTERKRRAADGGRTNPGSPDKTSIRDEYLQSWIDLQRRTSARAEGLLQKLEFCNLSAVERVHAAIPSGAVVHLGNSGTIRYAQLMTPRTDLTYFANRGTSGIDGSVSTAAGAASVSSNLHVLLVGDLSYVYDSNAFWNRNFPNNLRIIAFDDGGGGIFRLLEGPDRMDFFEDFSVTRHPVSLQMLARAFGRNTCSARNFNELQDHLETLFHTDSDLSVMVVDTRERQNSRIFKDFFKHMSADHG